MYAPKVAISVAVGLRANFVPYLNGRCREFAHHDAETWSGILTGQNEAAPAKAKPPVIHFGPTPPPNEVMPLDRDHRRQGLVRRLTKGRSVSGREAWGESPVRFWVRVHSDMM